MTVPGSVCVSTCVFISANPRSFYLLSELKVMDVMQLLAGDYLPRHKACHRPAERQTHTSLVLKEVYGTMGW